MTDPGLQAPIFVDTGGLPGIASRPIASSRRGRLRRRRDVRARRAAHLSDLRALRSVRDRVRRTANRSLLPVGTKSRLRLVGAADPSRRRVRWQWARRHVASDPRQFRDPLTESSYDLCVYDAAGLVLRAAVPAGGQCGPRACWQQKAAGFAYRDRAGGSSGIQRISLAAKQSATAESVEGKGSNVDLLASGVMAPLRIQLQAHDAQGLSCWEESYDGSEIEMAGARLTAHH